MPLICVHRSFSQFNIFSIQGNGEIQAQWARAAWDSVPSRGLSRQHRPRAVADADWQRSAIRPAGGRGPDSRVADADWQRSEILPAGGRGRSWCRIPGGPQARRHHAAPGPPLLSTPPPAREGHAQGVSVCAGPAIVGRPAPDRRGTASPSREDRRPAPLPAIAHPRNGVWAVHPRPSSRSPGTAGPASRSRARKGPLDPCARGPPARSFAGPNRPHVWPSSCTRPARTHSLPALKRPVSPDPTRARCDSWLPPLPQLQTIFL